MFDDDIAMQMACAEDFWFHSRLEAGSEVVDSATEGFGQFPGREQGRVPDATFDATDVGAVKIRHIGQAFLG